MTSSQAKKLCVALLVLAVLWITTRSITSTLDEAEAVKAAAAAVEKKVEAAKAEKQKKFEEEKAKFEEEKKVEKERIRLDGPADALFLANDPRIEVFEKPKPEIKRDPIPIFKGPDLFKSSKPGERMSFPTPRSTYNNVDKHKAIELQKQGNLAKAESEWEIESWRAEVQQKIYSLKREELRLTESMWQNRMMPKKHRELGEKRDEISREILDLNNNLRKKTNLKRIETETKRAHVREDVRKLNQYNFQY